jgi:site-specific DNA-methyltransferase (adenine-specific)
MIVLELSSVSVKSADLRETDSMISIFCEDCMLLMARYQDKFFDLAVCDPPYGIGEEWKKRRCARSRKTSYPDTS